MVKNSIKIVDVVEPIQTQVEEVEFEKDSSIEEEEPKPVKPIKERKKKAIPDVIIPPPSPIRTPDEKVVCIFAIKQSALSH